MPVRQKYALLAIVSLSLLSIVAAVLRMVFAIQFENIEDKFCECARCARRAS